MDQIPTRQFPILDQQGEAPGLLRPPGGARFRRATGQPHPAAAQMESFPSARRMIRAWVSGLAMAMTSASRSLILKPYGQRIGAGGSREVQKLLRFVRGADEFPHPTGDAGDTSETQPGLPNAMDFLNIATHEIGHAVAMDHPSDLCTEETMYAYADYGETKKRTLNAGDITGIGKRSQSWRCIRSSCLRR